MEARKLSHHRITTAHKGLHSNTQNWPTRAFFGAVVAVSLCPLPLAMAAHHGAVIVRQGVLDSLNGPVLVERLTAVPAGVSLSPELVLGPLLGHILRLVPRELLGLVRGAVASDTAA